MSWIRLGCSKFQPCTRTYSSDAVSVNSFKGKSGLQSNVTHFGHCGKFVWDQDSSLLQAEPPPSKTFLLYIISPLQDNSLNFCWLCSQGGECLGFFSDVYQHMLSAISNLFVIHDQDVAITECTHNPATHVIMYLYIYIIYICLYRSRVY